MFFGNELNKPAVWMRKDDAINAARWIYNQTRANRPLCILPLKTGGYSVFRGLIDPITVGYLSALMQRHDKPPVLKDFIGKDNTVIRLDTADVPFMSAMQFYDVLPKERPNVEPAAG